MKVVLREHVDNLGDRGQIVSVAQGYARNYLLPKRLAVEATPGNLKVIEQQRRVWALKEAREVEEAQRMAAQMAEIEISIRKKAGETGTLYGSVTNAEIAEALAAKGLEVDRRRIVLAAPIKAVGSYEIPIKVYRKVTGNIRLEVVGEGPAPLVVEDEAPPPADEGDE